MRSRRRLLRCRKAGVSGRSSGALYQAPGQALRFMTGKCIVIALSDSGGTT